MKIEHLAMWVDDIEKMKNFYVRYFDGKTNGKYLNPNTGFESYFISFSDGARLEIMHSMKENRKNRDSMWLGFIHMAVSLGSSQKVDELTDMLRSDGYEVISGPRQTGDGYYESCILDPEGNQVELTV